MKCTSDFTMERGTSAGIHLASTAALLLFSTAQLFAQPANDDPCGAIALPVGVACNLSTRTTAAATATPGVPAPGCASYNGADVWFTAVVPASGQLIIDSNVGVITDGGMALYSAPSCSGPFTLIECDDDDSANGLMPYIARSGLAPSSTVYIRFWEYNADNNGTFTICAFSPPLPAPACGATSMDPGGTNNYPNNANFTITFCPAVAGQVVTINFSAFATEAGYDFVYIHNGPSVGAPIIGTFSGTTIPGPITSNDITGCLTLRFTSDGTTRAAGWVATIACGPPPPPPANDNPCGAVGLTVNASCTYTSSTTTNSTGTTAVPPPPCANYAGNDVWFSIVVPASGNLLVNTNTGGITDGGMALYTATGCSGTFTLVDCDDDDSANGLMPQITAGGLTPSSTVYVRFWPRGGASGGSFSICATTPPPPPANDNPCGATLLPVNTTCVSTSSTTVNALATTGPPAPTCADYIGTDVWFRIVVPASGSVIIETFAGTITDGGMAVYTAPNCSGTMVQQFCDDDGMPGASAMPYLSMTGLAPTSSIWVRFWRWNSTVGGTFSICAHIPPPPPSGDCVYALNLSDSWGDGWGSSNVGVRINGGAWAYYTVGGSDTQVLLGMMIGDFIELSYDASGPFQGENSYRLGLLGGGSFFNSGTFPTAGASFGQVVDCAPPPAAPQDCEGGFTLCNSQTFSNNSGNSGNINDLNTANQDCLQSGEQQGTWYYFSPSASGSVGFTIDPDTDVDYDFAVWGPMTTVVCPPNAPPMRCSYASRFSTFSATGSYNTGAGNVGDDTSESINGDGWVEPIDVIADRIYILYVDNFLATTEPFQLTWQLSSGASLDCTLLPIELINLDATPLTNTVMVSWHTLSEASSDRFIVERSPDAVTFEPIGALAAAGYSASVSNYNFEDRSPRTGQNFYRVIMVDNDGTSLTSPVVSARMDNRDHGILVAPNPTTDILHITLDQVYGDRLEFRIVDAAGRTSKVFNTTIAKGAPHASLDLSSLDPGMYRLVVHDRSGTPVGIAAFVRQ